MQKLINIIYGISIALIGLALFLRPDEKKTETTQPINYDLYEYRLDELENRVDTLSTQDVKEDTIIDAIKSKIITDEKPIRNATNAGVDSIFKSMVSRQHKGRIQ